MFRTFSQTILYLAVYSVIGWICETVYCSIPARRFINRGFLKGPYCPMYGIGAMIILFFSEPLIQWPPLVFLVAMLGATVLEYFTGWLLETLFQIRWWDYSNRKFNLKGRICLKNSLLFGLMGLAMCYFLHPLAEKLIGLIPGAYQRMTANAFLVVFFLDLLVTLNHLLNFTQKLRQIQEDFKELQELNKSYNWYDPRDINGSLRRLKEIYSREKDPAVAEKALAKIEALEEKRQQQSERILKAFPGLKSKSFSEALKSLEIKSKKDQKKPEPKKRKKAFAVTTKAGSAARALKTSFLEDFNYYNLFWIFFVASIIGYVVETLFCLVTRGYIESRQGMLYGPLCQIYGFGAVLMALLLKPLSKKNDRWVFFGSALIGGAFEYAASWIQERLFGTVSWDYSDSAFSLGSGRASLSFMFFWGILGLWFIKGIYPFLQRLIQKIPKRIGRTLTAILSVLLAADLFLSACAVSRWSERDQDLPPSNRFEVFLDKQYPDDFMRGVYPNMKMRNLENQ